MVDVAMSCSNWSAMKVVQPVTKLMRAIIKAIIIAAKMHSKTEIRRSSVVTGLVGIMVRVMTARFGLTNFGF